MKHAMKRDNAITDRYAADRDRGTTEVRNMRYKRTERFRKLRRKKLRKVFVMAVVMPALLLLLGYLLASVVILPYMAG